MADLIDREALLDGLEELFKRRELNATYTGNRGCAVTWNDAINAIKDAPTAQPTQPNTPNALETLDCVNRQAVIDEVSRWCGYLDDDMINRIQIGMKRLPSAQPQRMRGRWIELGYPWFECSQCGAIREKGVFLENFCPNCGADMTEGQDG